MNKLPLLALLLLLPCAARAADPAAAWRAADDARVAAMMSADAKQLAATFSDDLLYVHSNGKPDTKAALTAAILERRTVYNSITYEQRQFREIVPGLVHMTGRCRVQLGKAAPYNELYLSVLAAYRLEQGTWRFIAWQSAKLDPASAAKK